jgi:hypothetical protein
MTPNKMQSKGTLYNEAIQTLLFLLLVLLKIVYLHRRNRLLIDWFLLTILHLIFHEGIVCRLLVRNRVVLV